MALCSSFLCWKGNSRPDAKGGPPAVAKGEIKAISEAKAKK